MTEVFLDVVDEEDKIIGKALRSEIHAVGLRHREVHVWCITPSGGVVFQRRAANKETFPNLLDATVGGHVELGMSYEDAALMEMREETGISVPFDQLHFIGKKKSDAFDTVTQRHNKCFRVTYGFVLNTPVESLKIEDGQATGFVAVPVQDILNPTPELFQQVISSLLKPERHEMYLALARLV